MSEQSFLQAFSGLRLRYFVVSVAFRFVSNADHDWCSILIFGIIFDEHDCCAMFSTRTRRCRHLPHDTFTTNISVQNSSFKLSFFGRDIFISGKPPPSSRPSPRHRS